MLLILLFSLVYAQCNECPVFSKKNIPIKTRIGPGCTCVNKYPLSNYDYIDVSYIYGQNIIQNFYQNNKLIGSCPLSKSCNKRINLNHNYDLMIETIRNTKTNSYGTITNQHQINFGINTRQAHNEIIIRKSGNCNYPPEINTYKEEQSGTILSNCIYEYEQMISNNFVIDMEFNNPVNVIIFSNNNIIYNETASSFFNEFHIANNYIRLNISTVYNTDVNWLDIYPIYDDDDGDYKDNTRAISISALVLSSISAYVLLIIFLYIYYKKRTNYNNNMYAQLYME